MLPGPLRKPLGITRPLLGPSAYAGLRFGVQQSLVADATISALGGRPVWFAAQAPITGFGGIEQQISTVEGNQYDRVAKFLTANVTLWPRPLLVFANRRAFTSLTADQQAILRQALAAAIPTETRVVRSDEHIDTASLCRAGRVRLIAAKPADLAALHRAVRPVYRQLERDPQTQHVIEEIEAMRGATPRETAPSCGAAAARSARAGPLDGVYRFTVTLSDLRAAGADPSELLPENFGTMTVVIDRERFASTQENKKACTWAYGTLTVKGDRFVQVSSDGGGIAPGGAVSKPGELFTFRWSLYRDTVKLRPVSGAVSPRPAMAKPWHRISTKASPKYFSKRCPPPAKALRP